MAIAYDATTSGTGGTAGSISFSHTCSALSNRYLIVCCWDDGARTPTVTYNGVAMTQILNFTTNYRVFGLAGPATGANTVSISWGGSGVWGNGFAISYTGISQTGQPDVTGTKVTGNPVSSNAASVTTVVNNSWAIGFGTHSNAVTAGANTTLRRDAVINNGSFRASVVDSNADVTPAGSRTLTETMSSGEMNLQVLSFAPAVASLLPKKSLLGVGS